MKIDIEYNTFAIWNLVGNKVTAKDIVMKVFVYIDSNYSLSSN